MDDDTTTVQPTEDAGAQDALPVEPVVTETADEATTTEPSEPSQDGEEETQTAPQVDDKLKKYAQSQGIELDSPSAIKAAQIAMKAQSEATRSYQKSNQIEKAMTEMSDASAEHTAQATGQDPEVLKRIQRMEVRDSIREFYDLHPEARQYEARMTEIAQTSGLYGAPDAILKAAYGMAVAENSDKVKSQGKQEALQSLAHKQQAAVPKGHATNPSAAPKEKPFNQLSREEMRARLGYAKT